MQGLGSLQVLGKKLQLLGFSVPEAILEAHRSPATVVISLWPSDPDWPGGASFPKVLETFSGSSCWFPDGWVPCSSAYPHPTQGSPPPPRSMGLPGTLLSRPFALFLPGFQELVQDGWFLEACQSISRLEEEGQDCGPQYEAVARSMWQVVQQALDGTGPSQELEQKLRAVLATVEWTQDQHERRKASAPQDGGVATWAGQLNKLLRNDAETQVPTLGPKDQLDLYLKELDKAVRQGLGSPRASRLGTCLWEVYRTYFHEVLLSRLSELTQSCGADLKSCQVLYTWGKTNLFEQPG